MCRERIKLWVLVSPDLLSVAKSIEIYDGIGKHINTVIITSEKTQINISNLSRGVYPCRIVNSANQTIVKRFIKE